MLGLLAGMALAESPVPRDWEIAVGLTEAGDGKGGRVDLARRFGAVQGRLALGYAPVQFGRLGLERVLVLHGQGGLAVSSEIETASAHLLVDWDLGARRVSDGWSGGLRLIGGLGISQLQTVSGAPNGEAVSWTLPASRMGLRPALGGALDLWWKAEWGVRVELLARRGAVGTARAGERWEAPTSTDLRTCAVPFAGRTNAWCDTSTLLSAAVSHAF